MGPVFSCRVTYILAIYVCSYKVKLFEHIQFNTSVSVITFQRERWENKGHHGYINIHNYIQVSIAMHGTCMMHQLAIIIYILYTL